MVAQPRPLERQWRVWRTGRLDDPADRRPSRCSARHTRLDDYVDRYAARTQGMKASEIRALFAVASRPEVVSLAGGMPNISGLPLDAVAETLGDLVRDHGTTAMQYGSGQGDPGLREQICDVMALEGIDGPPRRRRGHGRQPAGGRPGDPGVLRPRRRGDLRGAELRRRARRVPRLPVRRRARRDGRRRARPRGARAGDRRGRGQRASGSSSSTRSRTSTTRPASRSSAERRHAILEICRHADLLVLEDNPYGLLGLRRRADPGAARRRRRAGRLPRLVLQDVRARASGSAGRWRRTPSARSSCWPRSRRRLCPPAFSQLAVCAYLAQPRLARPDQGLHRDVPRAPRRDARRARRAHARRRHLDRARAAASTSGSPCPRAWTRRRCCRARSPPGSPTCPAPRSTPTASAAGACGCPTATRPRSGSARVSAGWPR